MSALSEQNVSNTDHQTIHKSEVAANPQKYLSIPALAKRWEIEEKLVYAEVATKRLTALRIGKKLLRVSLEEVLRYESQYATNKETA
jgi:hypothetical protein